MHAWLGCVGKHMWCGGKQPANKVMMHGMDGLPERHVVVGDLVHLHGHLLIVCCAIVEVRLHTLQVRPKQHKDECVGSTVAYHMHIVQMDVLLVDTGHNKLPSL